MRKIKLIIGSGYVERGGERMKKKEEEGVVCYIIIENWINFMIDRKFFFFCFFRSFVYSLCVFCLCVCNFYIFCYIGDFFGVFLCWFVKCRVYYEFFFEVFIVFIN